MRFPLETFLGGMETPRGLAGDARARCLETFLGGMETAIRGSVRVVPIYLETFLGGMETRWDRDNLARDLALKPSLVEWKLKKDDTDRRLEEP